MGFDYSPGARPTAAWLSRSVAGAEGAVPDTYGLSAQELAHVLDMWRARYADGRSS